MEQPSSSSKVTVEYFDPHDVYKLLAPGLIPRLPLRDLHWQSHAGPVRSIHTLHTELVSAGTENKATGSEPTTRDDDFQTATVGGGASSTDQVDSIGRAPGASEKRRHQIPGLRRTPYLKVLLVRCDDNDSYKSTVRAEIREWIKANATTSQGKPGSNAENHDAFEWLIIHVVIPNTVAATQPRVGKALDSTSDLSKASTSRWRGGSSTLLEKLRSDFNSSGKGATDRVRQIRIGINDVPYDLLPRVVPAVPTGYHETEHDAEIAWLDLIAKFKELILSSFDTRVRQYEEDIKEKDGQRGLPGWNFCTFFILKEGLARGFENVGLVEDALVVYDQLSVGLDAIIHEQAIAGSAEAHGGALLSYTEELRKLAQRALDQVESGKMEFEDEEAVDLQKGEKGQADNFDRIPISSTKKPYRELILANNVSLFDFRCYIFARQIALLLRLGNASSTREELLAKLKEQQELAPRGVAPRVPQPKPTDESENLSQLAEICRRALEFVPSVSVLITRDITAALAAVRKGENGGKAIVDPILAEVIDNIVASFAFSVAQQILAQTSTKALPIPPSALGPKDGEEQKVSIPEPKTMMHPARSTSLSIRPQQAGQPPRSPLGFPGPGRRASLPENDAVDAFHLKTGLEELAARRAELYTLSRNILEEGGKKRGWTDGWASVPLVGESDIVEMQEISLDDDSTPEPTQNPNPDAVMQVSVAGVDNELLRTALDNKDDFYRLYETLTDKALRHYIVASYHSSVEANKADLAVLKFHLKDYKEAADYFHQTLPFYGRRGWTLLEISMLIMFARCLKKLRKYDEYVNIAIRQLLFKAAAAERERLEQKSHLRILKTSDTKYPETSAIKGFLGDMLEISQSLDKEVRIPLDNYSTEVELDGAPVYDEGKDSFSLFVNMRSLLVDEFTADKISLRMVNSSSALGGREIWLTSKEPFTFRPGKNKVQLKSSIIMAGEYQVDMLRVQARNVLLHWERDVVTAPADKVLLGGGQGGGMGIFKHASVVLYQRARALDVKLLATKEVRLDRSNALDLEVSTGWNSVAKCEVKIRAATGGLRLLMGEASAIGARQPTTLMESGSFEFGVIPADSEVKVRFPFTVEHDVHTVAVRVEVIYTTENGEVFTFFKTDSVGISLALGVNVQDVFKHGALYSRFTVSTASLSPLRLFSSELEGSEVFEAHFGEWATNQIVVFPKQPACLLYKITRKKDVGGKIGPETRKTLYLKLRYTVLLEEIVSLVEKRFRKDFEDCVVEEKLGGYSKLVTGRVVEFLRQGLTGYELEKAALLGELRTDFLGDVHWERQFPGLEPPRSMLNHRFSGQGEYQKRSVAFQLAGAVRDWLRENPTLELKSFEEGVTPTTIIIPVDIPPITVVHTADIRFQEPIGAGGADAGSAAVCINQLIAATLHLKWTRIWDTAGAGVSQDLEFSYELTAPADTWLLGGRRKGHFVIPGVEEDDESGENLTSTPDTEADIPLLLIPLREGYLPYPSVDIREVRNSSGSSGSGEVDLAQHGLGHHCETDWRNLGETVHVLADRGKVTLSLDASGPGGGPLVLESETSGALRGRVVV
ncbi:trafficking protein particle complex subunit 10 [Rhypophila decipiens]|uniref:Trafficking protein particle complex subunit 10 n=1 Tax=Rhypophila decipiens TaxID=261697 RepID=A0AAN7B7H6_9PEZI|nr:trafficking protein particle complex subunit 10 [Rhypophila decipiens]